jgi:hypothetical protein
MTWRLAKSLEGLRTQINAAVPNRNKSSDGTIGDQAHSARKSDHNPDSKGVVRALDITHDPLRGVDAGKIAEAIRVSADPRVSYIISNGRIANSGKPWKEYGGANKHTLHFHVSVVASDALADNMKPWHIGDLSPDVAAPPAPVTPPLLRPGSKDPAVARLKELVTAQIAAEDGYGPITEAAVRAIQKKKSLVVDGLVGSYTWVALR